MWPLIVEFSIVLAFLAFVGTLSVRGSKRSRKSHLQEGKMSTAVQKHPDVIAWEKWKESKEGKSCLEGRAEGQYLENRLWRAFMEGRREGK